MRFSIIDHLSARPHTHRTHGGAASVSDTGLSGAPARVAAPGRAAVHGLPLHPLSTISGTYYVAVPQGAPGLKFEDPRLERFMASPPRGGAAGRGQRPWVTLRARAGELVLFESWLRHEVAPHPLAAERVSISFNYSWF